MSFFPTIPAPNGYIKGVARARLTRTRGKKMAISIQTFKTGEAATVTVIETPRRLTYLCLPPQRPTGRTTASGQWAAPVDADREDSITAKPGTHGAPIAWCKGCGGRSSTDFLGADCCRECSYRARSEAAIVSALKQKHDGKGAKFQSLAKAVWG